MKSTDQRHFETLKTILESKLGWGSVEGWTQRDFESLSSWLFNKTQTRLSVSTLKRLWRSDYSSLPQRATLDALARALEYEDWGAFKTGEGGGLHGRSFLSLRLRRFGLVLMALVSAVAVFFLLVRNRHAGLEPGLDSVVFTCKKVVSAGVPNTVVFDYDISGTRADSAIIQQSWDPRRQARVSREGRTHTSIYYYPGFHKARLILGGNLIREHFIHITTDGWLAVARRTQSDLVPQYLDLQVVPGQSFMHIPPALLFENTASLDPLSHYVSYYRVEDFGGISGDDFSLSAKIQNSRLEGGLVGQYANIIVMSENGRHIIPLCTPGCVANIGVKFGEVSFSGRKHDLSALGCNMDDWNTVEIRVREQHAEVLFGNEVVFKCDYTHPMGRMVGLHFLFFGCGAVDDVRLLDGQNQVVFSDDFHV